MRTYSERIFAFIGQLPHFKYCTEPSTGQHYLVRLTDGASYKLPQDPEDLDDGCLLISFGGHSSPELCVDGVRLAELAIVDASVFWSAMGVFPDKEGSTQDLLAHFDWKTTGNEWKPRITQKRKAGYKRFLASLKDNVAAGLVIELSKRALGI